MEALVGANIAALTIYDSKFSILCFPYIPHDFLIHLFMNMSVVKAVSHDVRIEETRLISKSGGKRDVSHGA